MPYLSIKETSAVISLTLVISLSPAGAQNIDPAPEGMAVVYFARPATLAQNAYFSYFDSTRFVGKCDGPSYVRYECTPGRHVLWARSENRDFIEADLKAGKFYFIEVLIGLGAIKAAVRLSPVGPDDEEALDRIEALLKHQPPERLLEGQYKTTDEKIKKEVERGMERYRELKRNGVAILKMNTPVN